MELVTLRKVGPAPVAQVPQGSSWVGAMDMSGTISEWVTDWFNVYTTDRQWDRQGSLAGNMRVAKGGLGLHTPTTCCGSNREPFDPESASRTLGFRCVRDVNHNSNG